MGGRDGGVDYPDRRRRARDRAENRANRHAPSFSVDIYQVNGHVHALIEGYSAVADLVRTSIGQADKAGDADTADPFTAKFREAWMSKSGS
jgi:DNA-binding ferritin-like protein